MGWRVTDVTNQKNHAAVSFISDLPPIMMAKTWIVFLLVMSLPHHILGITNAGKGTRSCTAMQYMNKV
jgi:hypothetical protein